MAEQNEQTFEDQIEAALLNLTLDDLENVWRRVNKCRSAGTSVKEMISELAVRLAADVDEDDAEEQQAVLDRIKSRFYTTG